jgi:hypothetical protein
MFDGAPVQIEVVRGDLSDERAEQLLAFWERHGALSGAAAHRRLKDVVCVLLDAGEVVGVNSAYAADVAQVGGLRFWVYRAFLPGVPGDQQDAMLAAAFAALGQDFNPASDDPVGLCLLEDDPEAAARRPEAEWREPRMVHAGFTAEGERVRVGYFKGALIPVE